MHVTCRRQVQATERRYVAWTPALHQPGVGDPENMCDKGTRSRIGDEVLEKCPESIEQFCTVDLDRIDIIWCRSSGRPFMMAEAAARRSPLWYSTA